MKLNKLPKDILVQLVSELQDRKEKEYSHYVVISIGDRAPSWRFENEYELKSWILFELLDSTTNNEKISLFQEELRKLPPGQASKYLKLKSKDFEIDELLQATNPKFVIIKGKCLTDNIDNIPLEY